MTEIVEELTIDDFVEMEKIDHQYFPDENIAPAKEAYKWYLKDKNATWKGSGNSYVNKIC